MGQFGSKGGLKKVVPLKKKPVKKVDPLLARIADLETMNDTLFKRTSELAQSIVTLVDSVTELHEDLITEETYSERLLDRILHIEALLEITTK